MNWGDIANLVKPLAPILGTALGGPLGGIAGSILGAALGLGGSSGTAITPETVQAAIAKGGDVVTAAIQAAEQDASARWGYLTEGLKDDAAQGQAINETMRNDIAAGVSWWHWRHLDGYLVVAYGTAFLAGLIGCMFFGKPDLQTYTALVTAAWAIFAALCALVGYVAGDTTRRITTAMVGEHAPTILGTLTKALAKK